MYDRAPRNFTFQSSVGTGYNLGPGTYQYGTSISLKPEGYAPFHSLAGRDFTFTTDDAGLFPSPAHYEVHHKASKVPGGTALSNKDSRFKPLKSDVPGPGNYCVEDRLPCAPVSAAGGVLSKVAAEGRKKLNYRRGEVPPSIPHAKTAYGYEEGPHGLLIRQRPPPIDTSLGPAFYEPRITDNFAATAKYKGCFWSNDKARRTQFGGSQGPAPTDYEPHSDVWGEKANRAEREGERQSETNLVRFVDELQHRAIKNHIPGPAAYFHSGLVTCPRPIYNEDGEKIEHPPFGVQAKRFHDLESLIPGPGSYNDPRSALSSLNKVTGMKRSPFGQTAIRFTSKLNRDIPGPQQYSLLDGVGGQASSYISATRKGGFGSTSIRNPDPASSKAAHDVPGPGHYQMKETSDTLRYQAPLSSMFASLTNRDYDPVSLAKTEQPDGLNYDVVDSYNRSQGRRQYAGPRTKDARRRHTSFMSHASRYSKGSPLDCVDPSLPGPGSYNFGTYLDNKKGKFYFRDKRFRHHLEDTPGPGQYEVLPPGSTCIERCEFNVSLGAGCLSTLKMPIKNRSPKKC